MQIAGHTEESIREALERANTQFDGNLDFKQLERYGKTGRSKYLNVRLTVKATRTKRGDILPGVHTTRQFYVGGGVRANKAASWDAHGTFFRWLYRLNPETVIRTGSAANGGTVLKSRQDLAEHWG